MRKLFIAFSFFVIAFSSIIFSPLPVRACEESPTPLRRLFVEADIIVIGRIGAPGRWTAEPPVAESRYRAFARPVKLNIEETIKGRLPRNFTVTDFYSMEVGEGEEYEKRVRDGFSVTPAGDAASDLLENKGRRIFFLQKGDDGRYTELYVERAPDTKITASKIYMERLRELAALYRHGEPAKARIAEFLVSLAEDRATRYDGVYELFDSLLLLEAEESEARLKAEAAENAEAGEEPAAQFNDEDEITGHSDHGDVEFARALTPAQKERLVRAFMNTPLDYTPKKYDGRPDDNDAPYYDILRGDDLTLMKIAVMVGGRPVADHLMSEVVKVSPLDAWLALDMLETVDSHFEDEQFRKLRLNYSSIVHGKDNETIVNKRDVYDYTEASDEQLEALPSKTFGARRAELLRLLLSRYRVISDE